VIWIWIVIAVLIDIFRRHGIGGWSKALWVVFIIIVPCLGVLIYLISNNDGMAQRRMNEARPASSSSTTTSARPLAAGAAHEIEKAKALLDHGTITQAEFDAIKAKALA
jgi:hypothetical protein